MKDGNSLTKKQLSALAVRLVGSRQNVYSLCSSMFNGIEVGDEIFDRLKKEQGISKCVECDTWSHSKDFCEECDGPME